MSDLAVGKVEFVRQEESTTSSSKLIVYFRTGPGYFQLVKFRAVVHISGYGVDKTVYSNVWTYGPFLNYVESYQGHLFVHLTDLPEGKAFMCRASLLYCPKEESPTTDTSDMTGTWKDAGTSFNYIASTAGMPEPFDWSGTNYSRHHGYVDTGYSQRLYSDSEGVSVEAPFYFNATAEQTKKAYKAITTGGITTDFSTRVWNDIVDRLHWIQEEWGYKEETGQQVIAGGGGAYAYDIPPVYRQKPVAGGMIVIAGSAINARSFNIVVNGIPIVKTWPWEKELGRKEFKAGDICKGSYFIAIVDAINRWISIVPTPISITDSFTHTMSGTPEQLSSAALESSKEFHTKYEFSVFDVAAEPISHSGKIGRISDVIDLFVENGSLPFASQFNFFDFNTETCKAASVDACVIGSLNEVIRPPLQTFNIGFADTLPLQFTGQIPGIQSNADIVNPQGCVIGEHGYTFGTEYAVQIDSAVSVYLEHIGAYGIVSKFTITPKDEQDTEMVGKIGIVGTIDNLIVTGADALNHDGSIPVIGDVDFTSSVGGAADYTGSLSVSGKCDIRSTDIVPLEFSDNINISATVDDIRISSIYEIPDAENSIAVTSETEIKTTETKNLGDASTSVGFVASASSNTDSLIEVSSDAKTSIQPNDAFLNSQKDVPVTGSSKAGVKTQSDASVAKYQFAESEMGISITSEGETVFRHPTHAEGAVIMTVEKSSGEIVCKPYITFGSDLIVSQISEAEIYALNMAIAKMIASNISVKVSGVGELILVKGQIDTETGHIVPIIAEGTLEYTVSTYINALESSVIDATGTVDRLERYLVESVTEGILVASGATVTIASVSLVLASEIEDTLLSDLDNITAYEIERKLTFNE